ncbi:hypothetical protein MGYG_07383 [Nannizzia gypsea CBS 118893]|uniref:Uncharacterized protein n=1 Tax=Arthroderma gypseum (strain ATCC MYA-4604 / CBS 118893) TaxID=535722 RepID=E4V301_ARTGP|nr:hypothetical protein MGYG_07383 [Nannizzia gypsea CBS 118893]EFR04375.1 hypothetical protein MGYG_07383 [Nannizzia gypsea CBS 118893]
MHLISVVSLCLLLCRAVAADTYMLEQPLNSTFTLFDNYSNEIVSPGSDMLEITPNATDRWLFEQIYDYNYIIRHSTSQKFLHFKVLQAGATARLSELSATVLAPVVVTDAIVKFVIYGRRNQLWLTLEPYNVEEPDRFVIRLQEREPAGQHQFTMLKSPQISN